MKKLLELNTSGGQHCITCSLKQVFAYYGWNISEAMLLGEPGKEFRSIAGEWEEIASLFMELHETCRRERCGEISLIASRIADREEKLNRHILAHIA